MKMCSSVWMLSVVSLLAMGVRTAVLDNTKHIESHRCHHCLSVNKTRTCEAAALPSVLCPAERPYCATIADVPHFTYSLSCATVSEPPCLLSNKVNQTFQITCICTGNLCNFPYTLQLQKELLKFSTKFQNNTISELTQFFFNSSSFANVSKSNLYKTVTVGERILTEVTTSSLKPNMELIEPRAEALKNLATVPPDDDEDDGEGSGLEEIKGQLPAAPAAPSSFLPSEQNHASSNLRSITLVMSTFFLYLTFIYNFKF